MAMNVRQTFLDNPENGRFQIARQASESTRNFQVHFDLAALRESFQVQPQSRGKSDFIQERRMQQMRNRPHFIGEFAEKPQTLLNYLGGTRSALAVFGQGSQLHAHCGEHLSGTVVEFASDASSFLVLQPQQPARKFTQAQFYSLALRDVANGTRHQHSLLRLQRAQANLDRKFVAFLMPTVKL